MHQINKNKNRNIVTTAIICFVVVTVIYSLLQGFSAVPLTIDFLKTDLTKLISISLTVFMVIWVIWDRWLWVKISEICEKQRFPIFASLFGSVYIPNLSGRWEGTYKRTTANSDGSDHKFVLEITQTASKISCCTYLQRADEPGSSVSFISDILISSNEQLYYLVYCWEKDGASNNEKDQMTRDSGAFKGTTILTFFPAAESKSKMLEGNYFTNRKPQT